MTDSKIGRKTTDQTAIESLERGDLFVSVDDNLVVGTAIINQYQPDMYKKLGYRETDIVSCVFNGIKDVQLVLLEKKNTR